MAGNVNTVTVHLQPHSVKLIVEARDLSIGELEIFNGLARAAATAMRRSTFGPPTEATISYLPQEDPKPIEVSNSTATAIDNARRLGVDIEREIQKGALEAILRKMGTNPL